MSGSGGVVALDLRELPEVIQGRRCLVGIASASARGQRRLEGAARPGRVAQLCGDYADVVLIDRPTDDVTHSLIDGLGARV